jgi:hypothetical protein
MPLKEERVEVTAKNQVACKHCHAVGDISVDVAPVTLRCGSCGTTLGEWGTVPQCIADLTAFITGLSA